jgi:hypothetical protein
MAAITEKMGLNYDLDGTELDYFDKLNENTLKIDAFLPLCVLDQIDLADLPLTPTDGEIYIVDSSLIYIRQQGIWHDFVLPCGMDFYDQATSSFYKYNGTTIFLDTGADGVLDAQNVGGQVEVYRDKTSGVLNFKTLEAGSGISIDDTDPDKLLIESIAGGFQTGDKLIFPMAAAPVGWTIDTTVNDRFVRISNSAGGGTGGTFGNFNHYHTHSHTHSDGDLHAQIALNLGGFDGIEVNHVSGVPSWTPDEADDIGGSVSPGGSNTTGVNVAGDTGPASISTTSTASITHGSSQHAYINAIICSKD